MNVAGGFEAENRRSNEVAPVDCQLRVGATVTPTAPFVADVVGTDGNVPVDGGVTLDAAFTDIDPTLNPALSNDKVICCRPAPSATGTLTVVQFCHPPVAGIATAIHTLLAVLKPT